MRRTTTIGRQIPNSNALFPRVEVCSPAFANYSSSSGRGRGTGPAASIPAFEFSVKKNPGKSESDELNAPQSNQAQPSELGRGHGRAKPLTAEPVQPAFSSFISSLKSTQAGAGRGNVSAQVPVSSKPEPSAILSSFLSSLESNQAGAGRGTPLVVGPTEVAGTPSENFAKRGPTTTVDRNVPEGSSTRHYAGRGKAIRSGMIAEKVKQENRHINAKLKDENRHASPRLKDDSNPREKSTSAKQAKFMNAKEEKSMTQEKGKWKGEFKRNGKGMRRRTVDEAQEDAEDRQERVMESDSSGKMEAEKFAQRFGVEEMNKYEELFKQVADKVVPSQEDEDFMDALHTNCMIEFEPEYMMGEFNSNPDIDEKSPISLEDFLEKVKPFMMPYMGIETHDEWEEAVAEVMESSPTLKKIVDFYSGPDRITSKKQEEELKILKNTIPAHTPTALRHFVDRAALSLQSNPGWNYAKKYQFMNKLVKEVQHYRR